jgi:hypothetical protein
VSRRTALAVRARVAAFGMRIMVHSLKKLA